ncbi:MAG: DUF2752 domain-containing protein [Aureliella sp.]
MESSNASGVSSSGKSLDGNQIAAALPPVTLEENTDASGSAKTLPRLGTAKRDYSAAVWFGGALLVLIGALMLEVRGGDLVALVGTDFTMPETCSLRGRFGIDCPGCGLTRSFIYIAHGDFRSAWTLHWVAPIIFAYVLIQLPIALWYGVQTASHRRENVGYRRVIWFNERFLVVIALLLLARWGMLLFTGS